jgi:DNA-binding MarR family transcriptional regulator
MMRDRTTHVKPEPALDSRLDNVLFDIWLLSRATTALLDERLASSELDSDEFAVYSVLRSTEGMTPTELAHWMAAPPTTVSSYVKRFESRGHIERVPNPDDGRSYRLRLTDAGRRAHGVASEHFLPVLSLVDEQVGSQAASTHRRLRALHGVVTALRQDG